MTRLIDDGIFGLDEHGPVLLGSRCEECGTTTFPRQDSCPACTGTTMADRTLPRRGTLWSFTVQNFRPKSPYTGPEDFVPYGVGYVDLSGEVIVESRLTENDPDKLRIGTPMELILEPFTQDEDGTQVLTFAFTPVAMAERS
jgi:uncharacterized OB-fold protein